MARREGGDCDPPALLKGAGVPQLPAERLLAADGDFTAWAAEAGCCGGRNY